MYKYIFNNPVISLSVLILAMSSCTKDTGNYDYEDLNKIQFINIDTVNGYRVFLGDTLKISPELKGSVDVSLSGSYSYEWKIRDGLFGLRAPGFKDEAWSTSKNLRHLINLKPGSYGITISVKDDKTGVTWIKPMRLEVVTPYYEGWLVLNKVADTTRLDFFTFADNQFTLHKDVLKTLNPGIPSLGQPIQIVHMPVRFLSADLGGFYLTTTKGTAILDDENFAYSSDRMITKQMIGNVPTGFKADKLYFSKAGSDDYDDLFIYANNNIYKQGFSLFSYNTPVNTNGNTGVRFKASPWFVSSGGFGLRMVLFNEDDKKFYTTSKNTLTDYAPTYEVAPQLNFPSGKELVYMTDNDVPEASGTNYAYAILKEPGISKYFMFRYSFAGDLLQARNYYEEITATDFHLAEYFAVSPELGYLFYSVGGKVYEYDLFLKTSKLMLDKGTDKISMLVFDSSKKPAQWKNSLMVGSYAPSGTQGSNGTLTQYTVPTVNGALVEQNKWTGLGQVVSVSYRSR